MEALTAEQVEQFHREGYLLVEGLFDPQEDIEPIIEEYKGVLDNLASELYASCASRASSASATPTSAPRMPPRWPRPSRCMRSRAAAPQPNHKAEARGGETHDDEIHSASEGDLEGRRARNRRRQPR
jgi:hypothetical protein